MESVETQEIIFVISEVIDFAGSPSSRSAR